MTRPGLPFRKYHALGNDYIVMDPQQHPIRLNPERVARICHRERGAGSDGILLGPLGAAEPFEVRIYNPDGGEAQRSGNGLRIFAQYLRDAGYLKGESGTITSPAGEVPLCFLPGGLIELDLGLPRWEAGSLPFAGVGPDEPIEAYPLDLGGEAVPIHGVSVGNPHAVILGLPVTPETARRLGPLVEHHPLFPERVNVQFVEVLDRRRIRLEIWERGAGYTLASGTSSSAVASVCRRLGLVDDDVTLEMPGGELRIRFVEGRILLAGPVTYVYEGIWPEEG
nr:diaminopimelate epimerase [uncultured Holophaga sp.]